ncbi:MAG: hypothetical protein KDD48_09325, partial [Bdellovibrionales bacterium]|nr:hypothetical protein [Bdellovibrionales bacterium]
DASLNILQKQLGTFGQYLFQLAHGQDKRKVTTHSERKSYSTETTFSQDVNQMYIIQNYLGKFAKELSLIMTKKNLWAKNITIKFRYDNFKTITRSKTVNSGIQNQGDLIYWSHEILKEVAFERPIRLLGLKTANFQAPDQETQLSLFS